MTRLPGRVLLAVAVSALLAAFESGAVAASSKPIVIAVEAPITGPQASNGVDILRGAQLAVRQVNARGGVLGRRVVLVRGDDRGDKAKAVTTAERVIARRPVAVIGPYNSSVGLANLSLYRRAKIAPLWLTSDDATQGAGITLQPMNSQIAPVESRYLLSKNVRKVAMLVDDTPNGAFTTGMADRLRSRLEAQGVAVSWISVVERAAAPEGYYQRQVAEALAGAPDVVYSSTYYPEGAQVARALQAAGAAPPCLMGLANVDPAFVEQAGGASQRCVFSGVPEAAKLTSAKRFVAAYRAAYHRAPGVWGVFSYDSANVLFRALRRAGGTSYWHLRRELRAMRDVRGQTGSITISPRTGYRTRLPFLQILKVNAQGDFSPADLCQHEGDMITPRASCPPESVSITCGPVSLMGSSSAHTLTTVSVPTVTPANSRRMLRRIFALR